MKVNAWVAGVFGIWIGVSATIGMQALLRQPAPSSSNQSSSPREDVQYQGFEENLVYYPQDNMSPALSEALDFNDWPEFLYETFNVDEIGEASDGSYMVLHDVDEPWLDGTIRFSRLTHITASQVIKWQYDFKPSEAVISQLFNAGYDNFDIDSEDILAFDNRVVILLEFTNYYDIFEENPTFMGDAFRPIGADPSNPMLFGMSAVAIDLLTYDFDIIDVTYFDDVVYYEWRDAESFGDHYLIQVALRIRPDYLDPVTAFGVQLNRSLPYHEFFFELLYHNSAFILDPLGSTHGNLDVYFSVNGLYEMQGRWEHTIDDYTSVIFEIRTFSEWNIDLSNGLIIEFSNAFPLISNAKQTEISDWFAAFDASSPFESVNYFSHAIMHTDTKAIIHEAFNQFINNGIANDTYAYVQFFFANRDDFIEISYQHTYNFFGQGPIEYQLMSSESTMKEYILGTLARVTTFTGPNGLIITTIMRTDHHFILGASTAAYAPLGIDNQYQAVGLILLMDRDLVTLDSIIINANADYWTDAMTIIDDTLYVLFWTSSRNPLFLNPETNEPYYSMILEVALMTNG